MHKINRYMLKTNMQENSQTDCTVSILLSRKKPSTKSFEGGHIGDVNRTNRCTTISVPKSMQEL